MNKIINIFTIIYIFGIILGLILGLIYYAVIRIPIVVVDTDDDYIEITNFKQITKKSYDLK